MREDLIQAYENILCKLNINGFDLNSDKYSGVFLPVPLSEYAEAKHRVMLVGRETAGWMKAAKSTIQRIKSMPVSDVVAEATARHESHIEYNSKGGVKTTSSSRFKQYYFKVAKELGLDPRALIYSNFFAWDYNKTSIRQRPEAEQKEIISLSAQLLAAQIKILKPEFIIFATGYAGIDPLIRSLFQVHFSGYKNSAEVIPKKLWEFQATNATCFRIAHPRATRGHELYRDMVIQRIKEKIAAVR